MNVLPEKGFRGNGKLSLVCSALARLNRRTNAAYDDIALVYAPRECCGVVYRGAVQQAQAILAEHGMTVRELLFEIEARGLNRFFYLYGLDELLPESELREAWEELHARRAEMQRCS